MGTPLNLHKPPKSRPKSANVRGAGHKVDTSIAGWVEFQGGGRIRNPPTAGDFVINATELRAINFSMQPLGRQLPLNEVTVRKSGRLAAVVRLPPCLLYTSPSPRD